MNLFETLRATPALLPSLLRGGRGLIARPGDPARQPAQLLELYEFEACPFCRKVRDVMSELDLAFISRTCAKGAATRDQAVAIGGRAQFPLLVDPNADVVLYESEDIIDHLHARYGRGPRPRLSRLLSPVDTASAMVASVVRRRGGRVIAAARDRVQPPEPLELYNFEASPYCRRVRERLHELDLHFVTRNVAKKSPRRPELRALGGRVLVPYLLDPNTDVAMYESLDIVAYLDRTYGG